MVPKSSHFVVKSQFRLFHSRQSIIIWHYFWRINNLVFGILFFITSRILYVFNKMTTVFMKILKTFLTISKIFGLINFCYTLESGLLCRHLNSTYYSFLEILRLILFILCSFTIYLGKMHVITKCNVIKYWIIIVTARLTEKYMIKYDTFVYL